MSWAMVGCSHHRTPLQVREKLAFSTEQVSDALKQFTSRHPDTESVLLSTCNRVEFYCAKNEGKAAPEAEQIGRFLAEFHGIEYEEIQEQLVVLNGGDAIRHLFMVAASLDSMILGEAQILSQVKAAYDLACREQTVGGLMHQAFQRSTLVARRVANETKIHQRRISVPSVAVSEIASDFFESFEDKQILLIGAGEMGTETLRYLIDGGAKKICIINRNEQRASELAKQFNATIRTWDALDEALGDSDLVISTTSSPRAIVGQERMKQIRSQRKRKALLILDLAVPRDIDPAVGELSDVYLFTVDDLQRVCDRNVQLRQQEWPKAEQIVEQETKRFQSELIHRGTGPTIKRLREQANKVKDEELERLMAKMQAKGMDEQMQKELRISFDRLVNKLLHPPMQSLRENAETHHHANLLDALRRLFQISD